MLFQRYEIIKRVILVIIRKVLKEFHQTYSYSPRMSSLHLLFNHLRLILPCKLLSNLNHKLSTSWASIAPVISVVSLRLISSSHFSNVFSGEGVRRFAESDDREEENEEEFDDAGQEPINFGWHLPDCFHKIFIIRHQLIEHKNHSRPSKSSIKLLKLAKIRACLCPLIWLNSWSSLSMGLRVVT